MPELVVATLLWDANEASFGFSRCYNEKWVTRLCDGFDRHLTIPYRFVLFTEKKRDLPPDIQQEIIRSKTLDYSTCIEPYRFGVPMILVGLDTVITGSIDHLADYCLKADKIALPRDPNKLDQACNGVALIPEGQQNVYRNWNGENDMVWMRKQPHVFIDDLFPGQVVSYKGHIRKHGLGDARIVYFHGDQKQHQLKDLAWIRQHWLGQ